MLEIFAMLFFILVPPILLIWCLIWCLIPPNKNERKKENSTNKVKDIEKQVEEVKTLNINVGFEKQKDQIVVSGKKIINEQTNNFKKIPTHKKILITYTISILVIFVFYVPWIDPGSKRGSDVFIGYSSLWDSYRSWSIPDAIIDWQRIIAEFVTVTVIAGIAFYLSKEKRG